MPEPQRDPFEGLYHEQVRSILTMRPTWSERWRMAGPMTAEARRDVLLDILFERRRDYLAYYHTALVLAVLSREEDRFGWQQRKADLQAEVAIAHELAERKQLESRMRAEGPERAAYYERKLNNGFTLREVRERRQKEIAYVQALSRTELDRHADRGRE